MTPTRVRVPSRRAPAPYEGRQRGVPSVRTRGFLEGFPFSITSPFRSPKMADLAFVVTVLAAFALVALVAKGVTKL